MAELNAFHGKLRRLIEANQAVANEAKRIADTEGARTLDRATIRDLALLFFDAYWVVVLECLYGDNGTEPNYGDLHELGQEAAKGLGLDKTDVNTLLSLLSQLCALWKAIFDGRQLQPPFRPAPKKKRPRAP